MHTHDFIAVGLGPFNLGLACLTDPIPDLDGLFLESKPEFDWHPGMLLETSTVQTPFLADLVTMADPTSPLSFLNYLKQSGRLYSFYIRTSLFPLRTEYNDYCRWAASRLDTVRFGQTVEIIEHDESDGAYIVHTVERSTGHRRAHRGRRLVLGTGTPPHIPESCRGIGGDAIHNSSYLDNKRSLRAKDSITIIGSGQSAAEIYYDLLQDIDEYRYGLTWITRSGRFFPLQYTKLTLEMTSPEYSDYFHALPAETRDRLLSTQNDLYKGISPELIDEIFDLLYCKKRQGTCPTKLLTNTALTGAHYDPATSEYTLELRHEEEGADFALNTQGLVLATGYRYHVPEFLDPIRSRISWDDRGRYAVGRNYGIDHAGTEIFVQNAELHTHGFVAPDLGMAAHRNSRIIREMVGREPYAVEEAIAFQEFGVPAMTRSSVEGLTT